VSQRTATAGSLTDPLAYSYIRFSTPDQLKGDSLRRQLEGTAEWCKRNNVRLDTSLTLKDLGVSAFRGKHHEDDQHCLGQFLKAVNQGKVPAGSFLVIENLDRLSREEEVPACHLLTSILVAGVKVVQLSPYEMVLTKKSNGWELMRAVMELSRGHGESERKSDLNGKAWHAKREAARAKRKQPPRRRDGRITETMTSQLPAWCQEVDGVACLIPERAVAVRRIYALAGEGLGAALIVQALNREGHTPFGPSGEWSRAYVRLILRDNRAMGECQPRDRNRRPTGDPIPGYFPKCVEEAEWQRAQGAKGRGGKQPRGPVGKRVNVFADLLHDARSGGRYWISTRKWNGKKRRVLVTEKGCEHAGPAAGFDLLTFESAVLGLLREVDPHDVLGDEPGQDEVIGLSNQLAYVEGRKADIAATLLRGDIKALAPVLEKEAAVLDAQEKELREKLRAAQDRATFPAAAQWGEAMSLIDTLDAAADPEAARARLRALLAGRIESIYLLVVARSQSWRLCGVQLHFTDDGRRSYLIAAQSAGHGRRGGWAAVSLDEVAAPGDCDLRDPAHAAALEAALLRLDPAALRRLLRPGA
jgi:DNA invertase Pin-like site-specific DNA recombinase